MNDKSFNEPTTILSFVSHMHDGRFTVLLTPTMTNNTSKWTIFSYSSLIQQYVYFSCDVSKDGLFDTRGKVYYSCINSDVTHENVFKTQGGICNAAQDDGKPCKEALQPIPPVNADSGPAISFEAPEHNAFLELEAPISFSDLNTFSSGYTIETWLAPETHTIYDPQARQRALFEKRYLQFKQVTVSELKKRQQLLAALGSVPDLKRLMLIELTFPGIPGLGDIPDLSTPDADRILREYMVRSEKEDPWGRVGSLMRRMDELGMTDEDYNEIRSQADAIPVASGDEEDDSEDEEKDETGDVASDTIDDEHSDDTDPATIVVTGEIPTVDGLYCLFGSAQLDHPSVYIDGKYRIVIKSERLENEVVIATSQTSLVPSGWNHVAITYTAKSQQYAIVINGKLAPLTSEHDGKGPVGSLRCVGKSPSNSHPAFYRGQLDELRIWDMPHHPNTIRRNLHFRSPGFEENLTSLWRFNEGRGNQCFDSTGTSF
jgi:uncharacterized Zn-finger protein